MESVSTVRELATSCRLTICRYNLGELECASLGLVVDSERIAMPLVRPNVRVVFSPFRLLKLCTQYFVGIYPVNLHLAYLVRSVHVFRRYTRLERVWYFKWQVAEHAPPTGRVVKRDARRTCYILPLIVNLLTYRAAKRLVADLLLELYNNVVIIRCDIPRRPLLYYIDIAARIVFRTHRVARMVNVAIVISRAVF